MLSRKSSLSKTLMKQRRRGHAYTVLPVWCAGHIMIIKSVRQVPDLMINAASSRLQINHVNENKNISFTVTHLVLKIKKCPAKLKMGKNDWTFTMSTLIPTHQRAMAKVRQRPSGSLFEPSGFFTLQLNLSWRHSRSSLRHGLFSFNYVHCKLDLLLAPTACKAVGSTSATEGTGRFLLVKIDRTASLLKPRSTISLCSTIYWPFHL